MSTLASNSKLTRLNAFQLEVFRENFPIAARVAGDSTVVWLTQHQLKLIKQKERNEKARIRMAKKREEIRSLASEQQEEYAAKDRAYKATYRKKNREKLAVDASQRRTQIFVEKNGIAEFHARRRARHERRVERAIKLGYRDPSPRAHEDSE
ncbi:hypothetical protein B0H14DRAFT_3431461 [Mycena olivaceomarginata]|nr:hypothetical protein B0H14DRAFT_3491383 [Mycena olivaceomarginata]KAJ7886253.1 hypothetical protein B0H14DRAFT_3431461 [Mycena olivaceomarginata]